ncbi:DUF2165 family protein [Polaromonas sp. SM01]|uniref:DUF2165 family protein n=1 Tax=Polaromonas sp. SM01 TaxID=3085630 RepID=UPI0029826550|nr:DUF2165 family protein [Polaromonas sp. SM01]MDW5441504.1 DUF2165 family protein [Polaromonas sp. SM01]
MDTQASIQLFLLVHAVGLALWSSVAALNNVHDFRGAAAAVGRTLSMAPLDEAPKVPTPLRRRAISSAGLHRLALLMVLALQGVAAVCLWTGCAALLVYGTREAALPWLNLGLGALSAAVLAMTLGGMAVAYWIRQETLQLTHLVLLLWFLAAFAVFNLAWTGGA